MVSLAKEYGGIDLAFILLQFLRIFILHTLFPVVCPGRKMAVDGGPCGL